MWRGERFLGHLEGRVLEPEQVEQQPLLEPIGIDARGGAQSCGGVQPVSVGSAERADKAPPAARAAAEQRAEELRASRMAVESTHRENSQREMLKSGGVLNS